MTMPILQTPRLLVREIRHSDFNDIFRIQSDEDMMRYIRPAVNDPAIVQERIDAWAKYHEEHPNYGVFILESLETGAFAGYVVARHAQFDPTRDLEVGYLIVPELEGRGLATEVTKGLVDYLSSVTPGLEKVVAFIDPRNGASRRVLEKCGFVVVGRTINNDAETEVFEYNL